MKKLNNYINYIIVFLVFIIVILAYFFLFNKKDDIGFIIKDEKMEIRIGETKKINYIVSDSNVNVEWVSSNNNVSVNSNGEVTAYSYGEALIVGKANNNGETIEKVCAVNVYSGDKNVSVQSIDVASGHISMKPNSEMELPFKIIPDNAYIYSFKYAINDETIATLDGNKIIAKNIGSTHLKVWFNNTVTIGIDIKVSSDVKVNGIVKDIEKISFNDRDIVLEKGDIKLLQYSITPEDVDIESIVWKSNNENVVKVSQDGQIEAISIGDAVISVIINDTEQSINVKVEESNADIIIDTHPKTLIRIGENTTIKSHLSSGNSSIDYNSSNPSVASVNNGVITGVGAGSTTISLSLSNGKTKTYTINVLPPYGFISGSANFWGYQSLNAKVPVRAGITFFQNLAQSGLGVLQGSVYTINSSGIVFNYNLSSSTLSVDNKDILVRIYYPPNEDLSSLNTLVYMGGRGETNFGSAFFEIDKDPSMIKSGGIVALLAEGKKFNGESAAYVTKFIKAITKQQPGVKNSLLGFSDGAHQVLDGPLHETYQSLVVFSGYVDYVTTVENAKDKEVIFIIAANDGNYRGVKTAINNMKKSGYKNVTAITNATDLGVYESNFLLHINPGSLMKFAHVTENIFNSKIIEYLND